MSDATFVIKRPPWLVAIGDDTQLIVGRSPDVAPDSEGYRPVADHIRRNRMVLVSAETRPDPGMVGAVDYRHYATPQARNLLMMSSET